jgi:hypothetical protein
MMAIKGKEGNRTQVGRAVPLTSKMRRGTACVINIISYTCTYLHNKKNREKSVPYSHAKKYMLNTDLQITVY